MYRLMDSGGGCGSGDERMEDHEEESGHEDDDQDVDDINHTQIPKETVCDHSPTVKTRGAPVWKHLKRITNHDVTDREIKEDCTDHIDSSQTFQEEESRFTHDSSWKPKGNLETRVGERENAERNGPMGYVHTHESEST